MQPGHQNFDIPLPNVFPKCLTLRFFIIGRGGNSVENGA
jgi:hypothetical protein